MLELLVPDLRVHRGDDRTIVEATTPLPAPARCVGDWLVRWATDRPETVFLAERGPDGAWGRTSYREALVAVESIAGGLCERGLDATRPVMILSDNSTPAALVALAAMHAGIPVSNVSPAYSLQSQSFGRLREVAAQLDPGLVFVDDPARYAGALAAIGHVATPLAELRGQPDRRAFAAITPATIAKVLFTSGSTGRPKGVVNTQRMLTANQESLAACWPFLATTPPVIVDWLPWSHTFGANHNFFLVLRNGGSLYIDRGRPAPGLVETTVANLADVSPNLWFNVPRGFDQAVAVLEADPVAAAAVFANLELVFYAAAALGPSTRARLEQVAARAGRTVFFTSAWGSTETAPLATSAHFATPTTGNLGVPVPGVQLALVPTADRLELRVRGPNVTPGYWQPGGGIAPVELDAAGFLPTGDAGHFVDPARPEAGIVFAGRLGENFKLSSGTWVSVAQVRIGVVEACAPLVLDAVIAGHDREALGALIFPSPAGRAQPDDIRAAISTYNATHPASSERIACVRIADTPLSLDDGETTDKGYTNQRRVLDRRAADITALFDEAVHRL
ncbi:MAG: AMP-binding protein [Kofleriaceae bacterium]